MNGNDLTERIAALRNSGGAYDLLKAELAGETASSLGHHGRQVEAAMAAIRAFDAEAKGTAEERVTLLRKAARRFGTISCSANCAACAIIAGSSRITGSPTKSCSGSARSSAKAL